MRQPDHWSPQPLLEEKRWSLLPTIHLSVRLAILLQIGWASFGLAFAVARPEDLVAQLSLWLLGAWALFYVTQRLGGREASVGGAAPKVRHDSPFQVRLLFDVFYLGVLVVLAGAIALGSARIRVHLPW